MMGVNILNMRGSLNGVWVAEMSKKANSAEEVMKIFKKTYRYGEDPNDVLIAIIDDLNVADDLTDADYDFINEAAAVWIRRNF